MNRQPSTTQPAKGTPVTTFVRASYNREAYRQLFADAREAFGSDINGLTFASNDRAYFQKAGDKTFYSIALRAEDKGLFQHFGDVL